MSTQVTRTQFGDQILLHYKLSSPGGEVFENTFDDAPITMRVGDASWPPPLAHWLTGLAVGERQVFMLEPAQAFGSSDPALVQTLSQAEFPPELSPRAGALMEFQLANGETLAGRIQEVRATEVVVDFNHPLCDCPLMLEVEILEITPAEQLRPPGSP